LTDEDSQIRFRLDQLMQEQGEYLPLELLLAEGRLDYADYEEWRSGDTFDLAGRLFGDPEQIERELAAAAAYARKLRLVAEVRDYTPWGGGERLRFSRREKFDALFHTAYRRGGDERQMDLFMDNAGSSLANAVVKALGRRNTEQAARQLAQLYRGDPANNRLGALERLLEAALSLDREVDDPEREMQHLREQIQPLAEDTLKGDSRAYLTPLWRRLDDALAGRPFDPRQPDLHRSYSAARMLDWAAVTAAVEAEPDWARQPVLLRRHAAAALHRRQPRQALADLFLLCWRFPEQAAPPASEWPADTLRAWQRFAELEPELEIEAFPAWLLILRPRLAELLPPPDDEAPAAYRLLYALQSRCNGVQGAPSADAVHLRAELKASAPVLFKHYIANL